MKDAVISYPNEFQGILEKTKRIEFDQLSDSLLGSLLATLAATKPGGRLLELGTGSGLSTSWLLKGMDANSSLISIDNDEQLVAIAKQHLESNSRVTFIIGQGEDLIEKLEPTSFDFIFADTWPGKYNHLDETLLLLKKGGIYIIDDMLPQENWPDGHEEKAKNLVNYLESREDLLMTKLFWSTGVIICTKIN